MGEPKIFISPENILIVPRSTLAKRGEGAGVHLKYIEKGGIYKSKINDVKYDNQKILTKVPLKTLEEAADKHKIIQYNRYNGRKRYLKISAITSSSPQRGMPVSRAGAALGSYIFQAKSGDFGSVLPTLNNISTELNTKKYSNNNKSPLRGYPPCG